MTVIEPDPEHFRRLLLQLREQLQTHESNAADSTEIVELDQSRVGRLSRMDAMQAQAMSQETRRRRDATLVAIGAALQRIERGDFGECRKCGELVNIKRLEFDPTVRLCIDCANATD